MAQVAYATEIVPVGTLDQATRRAMARLYLANYDGSCERMFERDLARKQQTLLLFAGQGAARELVGFTTIRVFEWVWDNAPIRVVYSGDTVVHRDHWGQQALAFAWISYMGTVKQATPDIPLYWLLLVKGHRTFRYLPVFGRSFYPHWQVDRSDLKPLADALAGELFPDHYNPATGVIEFDRSRGHLKPGIAEPTVEECNREGVRYFLERNPGFRRGHELVCLCEVEEHNMKPLTRRLFRKYIQAA